jgi:hypothetical protein
MKRQRGVMIAPRKSIFRDQALKHYTQGKKKDVLPNFSSVSAAVFGWLLLGLLIATGLIAAYGQVPVTVEGTGLVLSTGNAAQAQSQGAVALVFFPPGAAAKLQAGQSVRIRVGTSNEELTSEIAEVEPGTSSPAAALKRYGQLTNGSATANEQVVVALLKSSPTFSITSAVGSFLTVQVNAGTQSLFTALTGIGNF